MTRIQETIVVAEDKKHKLEFIVKTGLLNLVKVSLDGQVVFDMKPDLRKDRGIEIISIDGRQYELYWLNNIRNHPKSVVFVSPDGEILWMFENDLAFKAEMNKAFPNWGRILIITDISIPLFMFCSANNSMGGSMVRLLISNLIGFGAALWCLNVLRNDSYSTSRQLTQCLGISASAWIVII
jgi:hypothetical protein